VKKWNFYGTHQLQCRLMLIYMAKHKQHTEKYKNCLKR